MVQQQPNGLESTGSAAEDAPGDPETPKVIQIVGLELIE